MKCTDRAYLRRKKRKQQLRIRFICTFVIIGVITTAIFFLVGLHDVVKKYESNAYKNSIYKAELFADSLCVTNEEVPFEEFYTHDEFPGAVVFNMDTQEVIFSQHANDKVYPASTTKIMTAYLALKYGDLSDTVMVSEKAVDIPSDSSTAWLEAGDRVKLEDLIYGLMLPSGNDSAIAIAEHISGSVDAFVELMNEEANLLGATNTHYVNPHGYQDKEHYTTAYDLYLIFNECLKDRTFVKVISSKNHIAKIVSKSGTTREVTWGQSNQFLNGMREAPKGIRFVGGKTGNTFDAGSCLVIYGYDSSNTPYVSVVMGASSRRNLYDNMVFLWSAIEKIGK